MICFNCKLEKKGFCNMLMDIKEGSLSYRLWDMPRCVCPDYIYYRTDEDREI